MKNGPISQGSFTRYHNRKGCTSGTKQLVAYSPNWTAYFREDKEQLERLLAGVANVEILHVGSTSLPISAKDIIDVLVVTENDDEMKAVAGAIASRGERFGITLSAKAFDFLDQISLAKRNCDGRTLAMIHVVVRGTMSHLGRTLFKKFLEENPATLRQYEQVKQEASRKHQLGISTYAEAKGTFISDILTKAFKKYGIKGVMMDNRRPPQ